MVDGGGLEIHRTLRDALISREIHAIVRRVELKTFLAGERAQVLVDFGTDVRVASRRGGVLVA